MDKPINIKKYSKYIKQCVQMLNEIDNLTKDENVDNFKINLSILAENLKPLMQIIKTSDEVSEVDVLSYREHAVFISVRLLDRLSKLQELRPNLVNYSQYQTFVSYIRDFLTFII